MANQDFGTGQQYDEDMMNDQWAQQGGQQDAVQDMGSQMPNMPRGEGMGRQPQQRDDMSDQEQWEQQQSGLSGQPFSPLDEEPVEEEEEWQEEEEDISHLDQME
jgi:hypothetical protein